MTFNDVKQRDDAYHLQLYKRYPVLLTRGRGAKVWDDAGREYIDVLGGIAVNNVGHCHPKVVEAIQKQAAELIHCTNLYYIEPQAKLAELLVTHSDLDRIFFCNSGTEAVEGAIKLARKWASKNKRGGHIISMNDSFHGRTLAALTATGQEKFKKGLEPLPAGFSSVPFNDLEAVKREVTDDTCAILLEPVQGEGGVHPADEAYLRGLRAFADETDILLIFDEIQCGFGRVGELFAHQVYGVVPDIMTLAKALGGGFPIGALMAKEEVAQGFAPGDHGTTFGGNPLACAAGFASVSVILEENLPQRSREMGAYLKRQLAEKTAGLGVVREIRGMGLMLGVVLEIPGANIVTRMLTNGVLGNCTAERVIRFVPPLTISKEELDTAVDVFVKALNDELVELAMKDKEADNG